MGRTLMMSVACTAAATLAFCGYQYASTHPEILSTLTGRAAARVADPLIDPAKPPLEGMRDAERRLWELYQASDSVGKQSAHQDLDQLSQLVTYITERWREVGGSEQGTDAQTHEANLIALRAQFIGAKTCPNQFADGFLAQARGIVNRAPETEDAAQAEMLQLLYRHSLNSPVGSEFLNELECFARTHSKNQLGIVLYSTAAHELWKNDQMDSAKAVLERGVQVFAGQPRVGVLVNQLASQGHRPPPTRQLDDKSWRAYLGTLEQCLPGSTTTRFR